MRQYKYTVHSFENRHDASSLAFCPFIYRSLYIPKPPAAHITNLPHDLPRPKKYVRQPPHGSLTIHHHDYDTKMESLGANMQHLTATTTITDSSERDRYIENLRILLHFFIYFYNLSSEAGRRHHLFQDPSQPRTEHQEPIDPNKAATETADSIREYLINETGTDGQAMARSGLHERMGRELPTYWKEHQIYWPAAFEIWEYIFCESLWQRWLNMDADVGDEWRRL